MAARLVELGDDVGDRITDPGDLRQPVFGDEHIERDAKCRQAIGGSRIGLRPIGIAAPQGSALRVLSGSLCLRAIAVIAREGRQTLAIPRVRRGTPSAKTRWRVVGRS